MSGPATLIFTASIANPRGGDTRGYVGTPFAYSTVLHSAWTVCPQHLHGRDSLDNAVSPHPHRGMKAGTHPRARAPDGRSHLDNTCVSENQSAKTVSLPCSGRIAVRRAHSRQVYKPIREHEASRRTGCLRRRRECGIVASSAPAEPPGLTPQSSKPAVQKKENTRPLLPALQAEASTPPHTTLGGYEPQTYLADNTSLQHPTSYLFTDLTPLQHITSK